jgi:uncharacterized protein YdaU (DUF1376 family)
MAGFPSLPLFVREYLVDTTHLSLEESGAYLHLLMHAWARRGVLPDDERVLATFCKVSVKKWRGLRPALEPFFTVSDGTWTNERLSREWQYVQDVSEKRRAAGAIGGRGRPQGKQGVGEAPAKPGLSRAQAPTPTPTLKEDTPPTPRKRGATDDASFERFWLLWKDDLELEPGGKKAAHRAWVRLTACERSRAEKAAEAYAAKVAATQQKRSDGWNGAHLSTWLNGGNIDTFNARTDDGEATRDDGAAPQRGRDAPEGAGDGGGGDGAGELPLRQAGFHPDGAGVALRPVLGRGPAPEAPHAPPDNGGRNPDDGPPRWALH